MGFTINIFLRFALIAVGLLGGLALTFAKGFGFWYALPFLLLGIIMAVGYFLLGTVQSGAMILQTGDMVAAQKRLDLTFFPKLLFKPNRAYLFLLKGTIAGNNKDYELAEEHYIKAQEIGLPSDNEKAMVLMALTNFRAMKNNWPGAEGYFKQVKSLKITEPALKEQVKEMEKMMQQSGQAQAAMRQGFRGYTPGGKRPRPKMR
jgi:tetratricopeptide (TPR) repeat protein